jgi:pimeloyl-ACP methyl ester carboxylesterase
MGGLGFHSRDSMKNKIQAVGVALVLLVAAGRSMAADTPPATLAKPRAGSLTHITTQIVHAQGADIQVIAQGAGRLIVLLPSRGRGAHDFDAVARRLARAGYRVLRPQPRGIDSSKGQMKNITLHDLAGDVASVIEQAGGGQRAIVVGHAFGSWVARMTATDFPSRVRGVVIAASVAKKYPPELHKQVDEISNLSLPNKERLVALQQVFFAPGHDASAWLGGWYPAVSDSQDAAGKATPQATWWAGGKGPMLDLQAALDPLKPAATRNETRDEFGPRVSIVVIPNASHALFPEQPQAVVNAISTWERTLPR